MSARCLKSAAMLSVAAATAFFLSVSPAQACPRASLPAGAMQVVPTTNANQSVFNAAILVEINLVRCQAGLTPVKSPKGLLVVATNHANWMAKRGLLTHASTIRGQSTVQERVLASGLNARRGSENIGNLPRYQFGGARRINVKNIARCEFTTISGKRIAPHSYASLAAEIVGLWMKSPLHRKNVLDPNVKNVGTALGFDTNGSLCGQFFLSQNFAG